MGLAPGLCDSADSSVCASHDLSSSQSADCADEAEQADSGLRRDGVVFAKSTPTLRLLLRLLNFFVINVDGTNSYLVIISNRMNQVMKVLGIASSVFVLLTFVSGVYGMNLSPEKSPWNMP